MRFRLKGKTATVVLSRRNLATLLDKIDNGITDGESACTILTTYNTEGYVLIVQAEPDDLHYSERLPPGKMHPETESRIRSVNE